MKTCGLLVLITVLCLAHLAAAAQTISGTGSRDCEGLLIATEQRSSTAVDAYLSWAQGFISGYNWSNRAKREVRIDHAGLLHWLHRYCTAQPRTPFYRAVQEAVNAHAR